MGDRVTDDLPKEEKTWGQIFDEMFPFYLSIGMSADEYWNQEPKLAIAYRKAHQLRMQRWNFEAWMENQYTMAALQASVGNMFIEKGKTPFKYPSEPYPLTEEEAEEQHKRRLEQQEQEFMERMFGR